MEFAMMIDEHKIRHDFGVGVQDSHWLGWDGMGTVWEYRNATIKDGGYGIVMTTEGVYAFLRLDLVYYKLNHRLHPSYFQSLLRTCLATRISIDRHGFQAACWVADTDAGHCSGSCLLKPSTQHVTFALLL